MRRYQLYNEWHQKEKKRKISQNENYYHVEGVNIEGKAGRGIIVYIKSNISYRILQTEQFEEAMAFTIKSKDHQNNILFVVLYRSPNSTAENDSALLRFINALPYRGYTALITGDVNLPKINWDTWTTSTSTESTVSAPSVHRQYSAEHGRGRRCATAEVIKRIYIYSTASTTG